MSNKKPDKIIIQKSKQKNKRYTAVLVKDDKKIKSISFGDPEYQNFTQHKDENRKKRYLERHQGDNLNDIKSAGFYAKNLLWNKKTIQESAKDIQKKKGIHVQLQIGK